MTQFGANDAGNSILVGQAIGSKEPLQEIPMARWILQELVVMDFQEFDVRRAECGQGLLFVLLENRGHPVVRLGRRLAISHTMLRSEDFGNRPPHEDDLVAMVIRQRSDQRRHNLDGPVANLVDQSRFVSQAADLLPLEISKFVVLVRHADSIRHRLQPASAKHLHHQRSSRARQPRDDDDFA